MCSRLIYLYLYIYKVGSILEDVILFKALEVVKNRKAPLPLNKEAVL